MATGVVDRDRLARYAGVLRGEPRSTETPRAQSADRRLEPGQTTAELVATAEASLCDPELAARFEQTGGDARLACAVAVTDDAWLMARGAAVLAVTCNRSQPLHSADARALSE